MKRILCVVLAVILLAGCTGQPQAFSGSTSSNIAKGISGRREAISPGVPALPDLNEVPKDTLPPDMVGEWDNIELHYEMVTPPEGFLRTLEALSGEEQQRLADQSNFYVVGEYLLYYTFDSDLGYGHVMIEGPGGYREEILQSTQAVTGMYFSGAHGIVLELVNRTYPEAYSVSFYTADWQSGQLQELYGGHEFVYQMGVTYKWYNNHLYFLVPAMVSDSGLVEFYEYDEAESVFLGSTNELRLGQWRNNRLYFMEGAPAGGNRFGYARTGAGNNVRAGYLQFYGCRWQPSGL